MEIIRYIKFIEKNLSDNISGKEINIMVINY